MRLLLMSSIFTNEVLKKAFINLLSKPPSENKVLITHARAMLTRDITILSELGILKENISTFYTVSPGKPNLSKVDVLLVQGGNAFYYLSQIKKQGYWDAIRDYVGKGGVYAGISAGSMIMSPTVDENLTWDENFDRLKDVSGFGFVPFYLRLNIRIIYGA